MCEGREITSPVAAIAAGPAEAARIGARAFECGGNAFDAAAAAALACTVLEPEAADIGGYVACAVVRKGWSGPVWSLDANTRAPRAAHPHMFRCSAPLSSRSGINEIEYGCSVGEEANLYGGMSIGVPGLVAGIGELWERWGQLRWTEVVEPSQTLLENGSPYGQTVGAIKTKFEVIRRFPSTSAFLLADGKVPKPDDRWPRPDLQKTLWRLAHAGWRDFYNGDLGRGIAAFTCRAGGMLSRKDMAGFNPVVEEAYRINYRGAEVYSATLPNGGISVLHVLKLLEGSELIAPESVNYWRRLAEILKTAWASRLQLLGDPDFTAVPVRRFMSNSNPDVARVDSIGTSPHGTIHIAAADREGNLVSLTISQGGLFGSCLTVPGTGIILGHGMCRFDPHYGHPNSPGPRKRPLNNVCPLIILTPGRDIAIGMRGGRRIASVVAQLAHRLIDYGDSFYRAATAPRMHAIPHGPAEISDTVDAAVVAELAKSCAVTPCAEIGGAAHGVEYLRETGLIRAGGNTWAAGI